MTVSHFASNSDLIFLSQDRRIQFFIIFGKMTVLKRTIVLLAFLVFYGSNHFGFSQKVFFLCYHYSSSTYRFKTLKARLNSSALPSPFYHFNEKKNYS